MIAKLRVVSRKNIHNGKTLANTSSVEILVSPKDRENLVSIGMATNDHLYTVTLDSRAIDALYEELHGYQPNRIKD